MLVCFLLYNHHQSASLLCLCWLLVTISTLLVLIIAKWHSWEAVIKRRRKINSCFYGVVFMLVWFWKVAFHRKNPCLSLLFVPIPCCLVFLPLISSFTSYSRIHVLRRSAWGGICCLGYFPVSFTPIFLGLSLCFPSMSHLFFSSFPLLRVSGLSPLPSPSPSLWKLPLVR